MPTPLNAPLKRARDDDDEKVGEVHPVGKLTCVAPTPSTADSKHVETVLRSLLLQETQEAKYALPDKMSDPEWRDLVETALPLDRLGAVVDSLRGDLIILTRGYCQLTLNALVTRYALDRVKAAVLAVVDTYGNVVLASENYAVLHRLQPTLSVTYREADSNKRFREIPKDKFCLEFLTRAHLSICGLYIDDNVEEDYLNDTKYANVRPRFETFELPCEGEGLTQEALDTLTSREKSAANTVYFVDFDCTFTRVHFTKAIMHAATRR